MNACASAVFNKEPCRYRSDVKGCANSTVKNMPCSEPGLNSYGCKESIGSCYYDGFC
jgi:hypothetical protein